MLSRALHERLRSGSAQSGNDLVALGPLLAAARADGLIADDETERLFSYRLDEGDRHGSDNWRRDEPFSGFSVLFGNYVAGRRAEYDHWYRNTHGPKSRRCPAMSRSGAAC